ncbi:hypothetical protein SPLC1_S208470 [Arthrospira platensis C1]|nr:hypothetical protein SPLC1_S208470 [Arthrospira platensis C1]
MIPIALSCDLHQPCWGIPSIIPHNSFKFNRGNNPPKKAIAL